MAKTTSAWGPHLCTPPPLIPNPPFLLPVVARSGTKALMHRWSQRRPSMATPPHASPSGKPHSLCSRWSTFVMGHGAGVGHQRGSLEGAWQDRRTPSPCRALFAKNIKHSGSSGALAFFTPTSVHRDLALAASPPWGPMGGPPWIDAGSPAAWRCPARSQAQPGSN